MESVVGRLEGVLTVNADFIRGTATVEYDPALVTPQQIVEGINSQTFYRARLEEPNVATAILSIPGLTDQAAIDQINAAFDGIEGIRGGTAAPGTLTIEFDPDLVTAEALVAGINDRTSLEATLLSVQRPEPAERGVGISPQFFFRYGLWGALVAAVLYGGWRLARRRRSEAVRA